MRPFDTTPSRRVGEDTAQTIYFDTIGCRLNQREIEMMGRQARAAGMSLTNSAEKADWVVLNSCTVTSGGWSVGSLIRRPPRARR